MKSVLYLENSRTSQILMQGYLEGHFDLSICETVEDAERTLQVKKFDLIIADFMLQRGDASDFIRGVRQNHSPQQLPIIVASGAMDAALLSRVLAIGANDVVSKPIDRKLFRVLVDRMLQKPYIREPDRNFISVACAQWRQDGLYFEYCPDVNFKLSGSSKDEVSQKMVAALHQLEVEGARLGHCYNERTLVHVIESQTKTRSFGSTAVSMPISKS